MEAIIKTLASGDYDKILIDYISKMNEGEVSYLNGGEGEVLLDKNYAIKRYAAIFDKEEIEEFEKYCNEIQGFNLRGYCVPKVYSFAAVPQDDTEEFYDVYMLQERIKGRDLSSNRILFNCYYLCKNFCTKDKFNKAIFYKNSLYNKIIETVLKKVVDNNNALEAISESALDKFILSDFYMTRDQEHSMTDINPGNVIFDQKSLTIIDNAFENGHLLFNPDEARVRVLKDILWVFSGNRLASYNNFSTPKAKRLAEENTKILGAMLKKFVKRANKLISPVIKDEFDRYECNAMLEDFDDEGRRKILEEIQFER